MEATDPDTGDVLGYTLSGADADSFTIDVASGQIRVGVGTMLDRESKDTYRVTVTASDPSTATDTAAVTITIEDVNEGFTVSGPDHISREENTTGVLATFTAIDPEGSPLAWSLEGVDTGRRGSMRVANSVSTFHRTTTSQLTCSAPTSTTSR